MFGFRKGLLAKAIARQEGFDAHVVANELEGMSESQLDNLEERYDKQIANLLSMNAQQKLCALVDG